MGYCLYMDKNITLKNNNTQRATRNARKSTGSNVPVPVVGGVLRGIHGYKGYKINNKGEVISIAKKMKMPHGGFYSYPQMIRKQQKMRGYMYVKLMKNGIPKMSLVHRLVAEAFIPNINKKPCVNHKDSNRANNNVSNLEWVTHKENMEHASRAGHMTGNGELVAKLTRNEVYIIRKLKGKRTTAQIAFSFGVAPRTIRDIFNGRTWNKV